MKKIKYYLISGLLILSFMQSHARTGPDKGECKQCMEEHKDLGCSTPSTVVCK